MDGRSIEEFCRRWQIAELSLFGSLARGDFRHDSDADVLVTFQEGADHSPHDHFVMIDQLREIFGRKVDLAEERLLSNPYRRHNILLDKKILYPPAAASRDVIRDGVSRFDRDIGLILDIVKAGRSVIARVEGKTFDEYREDETLRLAVERLLITIGEASRAFSAPFRAAHPEIPWSEIIGERNILVHQYEEIKNDKVWGIATVDVPRLLEELQPLLPPRP
jgi:uncharacterized protein with HEPN domain/predicted nucleotidyltransferase